MLLNSTQGIASSQVEEESSLLRRKIEDQSSLLRGKVEELNQNTVLLIAEAGKLNPRIETAIGSAQVLRRP
jgi:hypothetical protein